MLVTLGVVFSISVAAVGVLAVTRGVGDESRAPSLQPTSSTATSTTVADDPDCRSPLTVDDPLRLWIGGDSLAGSLGPSLGALASDTGVVATTYDSRVSSGLASPEVFDWPKQAAVEIPFVDPEVAVFMVGTNDFNLPRPQPLDLAGRPAWKAQYEVLVEQMLDLLDGDDGDRPVIWVGAPPMQDRRKDAGVREINEVERAVVARHPDAVFLDTYTLFAGPDGRYAASLPDDDGRTVRMRAADGIHFTPEGGDRLARAVLRLLDERCAIEAQAVEGAEQPIVQAPGSSQVPGTHRTPITAPPPVTTPTTLAPTTAPPTTTTAPPVITIPTLSEP